MRAVLYRAPKMMRVENVEEPRIEHPRDAVLRVTSTAICGSDLHIYNGLLPQLKPMVPGHEFMGVVEEVGPEVTNLEVGDRVVVPFPIADGTCWFCTHGLPIHCENSNPEKYGPGGHLLSEKGGALFGYTDLYGGYPGGQAEKVRVPFADHGPRKVPDGLRDEQVLFLTDILPTAFTGVTWVAPQPGETVAVYGCGPVGLMALKVLRLMGVKAIGVDILPYRCEVARRTTGAEVVNAADESAVDAIRARTDGRGADAVIDAVGMEADRNLAEKLSNIVHLQRGSMKVVKEAFESVRRGGRVALLGVYGTPFDNFPLGQMFDKGISVTAGQAPVHNHIDHLMDLVASGKLVAEDIITHTPPLDEAPHAYEIFNQKLEDCVKVVLKP